MCFGEKFICLSHFFDCVINCKLELLGLLYLSVLLKRVVEEFIGFAKLIRLSNSNS